VVVFLLACGCNSRPDRAPAPEAAADDPLTQQAINLYNEATQALGTIKDRPTAAAAAAKLKVIAGKLQDLARKGVALPNPIEPSGGGKYSRQLELAVQRYADAMVRWIDAPNVGPELPEALGALRKLHQ
jgi:hypothetical protein